MLKGKLVFEGEKRGYRFVGTDLIEPKGDSLIEIFKGDLLVKKFLFPAYKIWNIPAHADDIINGLEEGNDNGLYAAGSTGLGMNAYSEEEICHHYEDL